MHADPRIVSLWVMKLGGLCAVRADEDAQVKTALYTEMLVDQFGPEVFCQRALRHVANKHTFFPAYAELAASLGEWRRENANAQYDPVTFSAPPRLTGPTQDEALRAEWSDTATALAAIERIRSDLATGAMFATNAASVLRVTLERHAPEHVHLLDAVLTAHERAKATQADRNRSAAVVSFAAAAQARAGQVTPAQLAAIRAAARPA